MQHGTQMSVRIAREDRVRDESRRAIKVVCRPRTQVLFDTLLIGGLDDEGNPVVNEMIVYESDLPKVQAMVETETSAISDCAQWVEDEWAKALAAATDQMGRTNLQRSDFHATKEAEFERRMRRGIKPLVSVEVGETLLSPVAIARKERMEQDGNALDMLAAKVAERMNAGGRGDEKRR